ncbi:ricin-type beta-trefoil lectin domain protein [Streptacidiphilus sp. N1-12]|uniref:Ricin-type beta-trefoil lectin domain protein n=2 Tax=Streptacidiphilus alkalitolerans TaxID=3342712 RepID=A0ABV6WNB9_9ACTN
MRKRTLTRTIIAVCIAMIAAVAAVLTTAPAASASTTQSAFVTFYGWWDNTPPGGDISYPQLHDTAGGTGTYADPITFASDSSEFAPGTKIYVARVKKYFIMEDGCDECSADWKGKGPDGGPKLWHTDLWLGGQGGNAMKAIQCEDALTNYNADNTPSLEPVVVSPPSNETYDPTPIFNTSTGACYGGATPIVTVGQYKNSSTATCMDDPGNSASNGVKLDMAACNGSAQQQFTFDGTFFQLHNLCADMSGSNLDLKTCTGGPTQQWSANTNGTISDIQTGKKCFRASGTTLTAGSCSGAAAQWTFPTGSSAPPTTTPPTTPPPTTAPPTTTPPTTTPPTGGNVSYEAEAATLAGGTTITSCAHCSGGKKLSYLGNGGTATFTGVSEPAAGSYTLTIYFMSVGQARTATVTANGVNQTVSFPETPDYNTVVTKTITVQLNAGNTNTIEFSNPSAGAPNLDRIVV